MEMSDLRIKRLSKRFGTTSVLNGFSLNVDRGQITVLVAPSGAGKTTLLRLVAGLDKPDSGVIEFDDGIAAPSADVGYIFQHDSAFPWLTVRHNIGFGLELRANVGRVGANTREEIIREMSATVGLGEVLERFPRQLSGGQRQRVVIARSLVLQPRVLLCDEPFSALDDRTRQSLREQVLLIRERYRPTIIFITHHVEEALFLADKVVVCDGPPLTIRAVRPINFDRRDVDLIASAPFREELHNIQMYTR
jgi:ABC-type nitrate/sulfonate/bicarbonate transport system ATPase subunit